MFRHLRPRTSIAIILSALVLAGALVGCGNSTASSDGRPTVIVTTSILGDLVAKVAGDQVSVEVLMPPGADPHDFEASASQSARMRDAALIVANGLGLEERLGSTIASAEDDGITVLEIGPLLDPIDSPGTDRPDPHVWLDPERMARAATIVADSLATTTGLDRAGFDQRAAAYAADARAAGAEAERIIAGIPADQRLLVTNHDALEYFADRFRLEIIGTVIPGGSTLAEPSAQDITDLVDTIRAAGVGAIFSETTTSSKLIQTVANELGRSVEVIELPTDSLGAPGTPTSTYPGLITTIARLIADGLTSGARG